MPLETATALSAVDEWQAAAGTPIPDPGTVAAALVRLADAAVPLIVDPDNQLTASEVQHLLLARVTDDLTDWLAQAAAGLRAHLRIGAVQLSSDGNLALGVRSASVEELDTVPGIGAVRAAAVARLTRLHPDFSDLGDLSAIDGVGDSSVSVMREHVYLDSPTVALTSAALVDFALHPGPASYLRVLHSSDLELIIGDGTTLRRRPPSGGTLTARFVRLINIVTEHATLTQSPASGVMATDAAALLARRELLRTYLAGTHSVDGIVLADDAYLPAALSLVEAATDRVMLMVFLGTDTPDEPDRPGPAALIDALESRAAAGVAVRVILDQDEDGKPYRSLFINRRLHDRLDAGPVHVKFDTPGQLLHSKVLVVDRTAVIVGSHNWTLTGLNDAHELSVLLTGSQIVDAYARRFQSVWDSVP